MSASFWEPLWRYCEVIAPDIIPENNGGYYNDGWGLNNKKSLELAHRLQEWFDSGDCEKWKEEVERAHTKLASSACPDCTASKQSVDFDSFDCLAIDHSDCHEVVGALGANRISASVHKHNGNYVCGTCRDTGIKSDWVTRRTFSVESVPGFIKFLSNCSGFSIW